MIFDFLFKKKPGAKKKRPAAKTTTKKSTLKKAAKKAALKPRKKTVKPKPKEELVGKVTHYFPKVRAGVVKLNKPLNLGESVHIKGHTTDFIQKINSLQINNAPVKRGVKGKEVGFGSRKRVRKHDKIYRIKE